MSIRVALSKTLKSIQQLNKLSDHAGKISEADLGMLYQLKDLNDKVERFTNIYQQTGVEAGLPEVEKENSFSIVTSAYNNASYINDYFASLLKQSNWENLQVIIVDDGSTDNTAELMQKWVEVYPENVTYVYQPNAGQSAARNNGLTYATNDWVTFIDMDDFVSENYFYEINRAINDHGNESPLYINKWVNYIERTGEKINKHPLNWRFNDIPRFKVYDIEEQPESFYLSASSTVFNNKYLRAFDIKFENIKPNFEDAHFIATYIQKAGVRKQVFLRDTIYYYRKRRDASSTVDTSLKDKRKYYSLLNDAYLRTLEQFFEQDGKVPAFVQKEVLYDLRWNFEAFIANADLLSDEEVALREKYLRKIFNLIDLSVVQSSQDVTNQRFLNLVAKEYYGVSQPVVGTYVQRDRGTITFALTGVMSDIQDVTIDGVAVRDMLYAERPLFLSVNDSYVECFVKVPMQKALPKIMHGDEAVALGKLNKGFEEKYFTPNSTIVFYDRADKADDNAEVMYEWFMENKPNYKNIYFALKRDAPDWERLAAKGFQLIPYGEEEFETTYKKADFIISAAGDDSIHNYERYRYFWYQTNAKFIFLQHGVMLNDLSPWLWGKRINQMVISSTYEQDMIKQPKFTLFEDELMPVGLPRFDRLYNDRQGKILAMFTWRRCYEDMSANQFMKTEYAQRIIDLMTDPKMLAYLQKYQLTLDVVLHPSVNKHCHEFEEYQSENVVLKNTQEHSYRQLFAEGDLMITDYSSTTTDFAYLEKPIIYYQWDYEEFYGGGHTYTSGMDYATSGFGPVEPTFDGVMKQLDSYAKRDFDMGKKYRARKREFFIHNDQNNSQRVFDSLVKLYGKKA